MNVPARWLAEAGVAARTCQDGSETHANPFRCVFPWRLPCAGCPGGA